MNSLKNLEDSVSAVTMICKAVERYLFEPPLSWSNHEFKKRVYQRWAAEAICKIIINNPFEDPVDTMELYITEMEICRLQSEENKSKGVDSAFIFATAIETAEDLIQLLV